MFSHYTKLLTLLSPIFQVVAVLDVVADVAVTAVVVVDVAVVARRTRRLGRFFITGVVQDSIGIFWRTKTDQETS